MLGEGVSRPREGASTVGGLDAAGEPAVDAGGTVTARGGGAVCACAAAAPANVMHHKAPKNVRTDAREASVLMDCWDEALKATSVGISTE